MLRGICTLYFLLIAVSLCAQEVVYEKAPPYLFHWLKKESLDLDYKLESLAKGELPLPWMYKNFNLVSAYPDLEGKSGLFAWTHPVTGIGATPAEIYGNMLVLIETTQEMLKILKLTSGISKQPDTRHIDLSKIDLIYHQYLSESKDIIYEEWIITSQRTIREFTADPDVLKPIVSQELEDMRRGKRYQKKDLHFKKPFSSTYGVEFLNHDYARQELIFPILEQYLQMKAVDVPEGWRRSVGECSYIEVKNPSFLSFLFGRKY